MTPYRVNIQICSVLHPSLDRSSRNVPFIRNISVCIRGYSCLFLFRPFKILYAKSLRCHRIFMLLRFCYRPAKKYAPVFAFVATVCRCRVGQKPAGNANAGEIRKEGRTRKRNLVKRDATFVSATKSRVFSATRNERKTL